MQLSNINHLETLIGSINKMFINAKNKGIINNKELSLLNIIYKLVNYNCYSSEYETRQLLSLYYKILNKYNFLCKSELSRNYNLSNNIKNIYIDTNHNTAPVVVDPDPIEPPVLQLPITCGKVLVNGTGALKIVSTNFLSCFEDPNEGEPENLKITTLPINGILIFNEENIEEGQVISIADIDQMVYITFVDNLDTFGFKVSGSNFPDLYSLEYIMTIETAGI